MSEKTSALVDLGLSDKVLTDTEAMSLIHQILDGTEWDSDTTLLISEIVEQTGRTITDLAQDDEG